jgi:hypothetical protein
MMTTGEGGELTLAADVLPKGNFDYCFFDFWVYF